MMSIFCFLLLLKSQDIPVDFVNISQVDSSIQLDIKYYATDNFLGRSVAGYKNPKCILTKNAAKKLAEVQSELMSKELSLKIFDCYRPQKAVDDFVKWAKDLKDQKTKAKFYPNISKESLFRLGYIAEKSGHSRGSTVDLSIMSMKDGLELDMGTSFDFFDKKSSTFVSNITDIQQSNRLILKNVMERHGFRNYSKEWWHYTLVSEPYPTTYFNFYVQ